MLKMRLQKMKTKKEIKIEIELLNGKISVLEDIAVNNYIYNNETYDPEIVSKLLSKCQLEVLLLEKDLITISRIENEKELFN